jgi:hypothetical protein
MPLSFILLVTNIFLVPRPLNLSTINHWIVITKPPRRNRTLITRQMIWPRCVFTISLTKVTEVRNFLSRVASVHAELDTFHILGFGNAKLLPAKLGQPIHFQLTPKEKYMAQKKIINRLVVLHDQGYNRKSVSFRLYIVKDELAYLHDILLANDYRIPSIFVSDFPSSCHVTAKVI